MDATLFARARQILVILYVPFHFRMCVCVCVCLGGGTYIFHFCAVNFEVFETFILECSECVRNHLHGHRNERLLCATFVSFWLFDWYNTEKMRGVGGNIYIYIRIRAFILQSLSLSLSPCIQLNYVWCLRISTATITSSNSDCSRIHVLFSFSPTRVFLSFSPRTFGIPFAVSPPAFPSIINPPPNIPAIAPPSISVHFLQPALFLSFSLLPHTSCHSPTPQCNTHTHTREMMSVSLSAALVVPAFPPVSSQKPITKCVVLGFRPKTTASGALSELPSVEAEILSGRELLVQLLVCVC